MKHSIGDKQAKDAECRTADVSTNVRGQVSRPLMIDAAEPGVQRLTAEGLQSAVLGSMQPLSVDNNAASRV